MEERQFTERLLHRPVRSEGAAKTAAVEQARIIALKPFHEPSLRSGVSAERRHSPSAELATLWQGKALDRINRMDRMPGTESLANAGLRRVRWPSGVLGFEILKILFILFSPFTKLPLVAAEVTRRPLSAYHTFRLLTSAAVQGFKVPTAKPRWRYERSLRNP